MELRDKLEILADAAKYDASCASSGVKRKGNGKGLGNSSGVGICHSYTPDGRCVSLLKILLTNYCVYDCNYCVNRISNDVRRARFTIDEVVDLTIGFYTRNYIEGLFLSSGIVRDPDHTMEQLGEVARRLRVEHDFNGYIHLKAVPGASPEAIALTGRWADRLSANVELPTQEDLDALAPAKRMDDVEDTMAEIRTRFDEAKEERKKSRKAPKFSPAGQSTQMIVGATPSSDATILERADRLYNRHRLKRVYYSAFSPIPGGDPRLPPAAPPLVREHRLYQADWLMRFYGYDHRELTEGDENLELDIDPKLAWALRNRDFFPVDVNRSPREALLRVPGLGVRSVRKILKMRRFRRLRLDDLRRMKIGLKKARSFIVTADANPHLEHLDRLDLRKMVAPRAQQLDLFATALSATSGEV
jgi:putative DNA modification/repair radical SAM protein